MSRLFVAVWQLEAVVLISPMKSHTRQSRSIWISQI